MQAHRFTESPDMPKTARSDLIMVGIAQGFFSKDPNKVLCAPNLGSCLGICIIDPKRKVSAMVHCLLPTSSKDKEKAKTKPYMYVDSALSKALNEFIKQGSKKDDLIVVAAGGAAINDNNGYFNIGKKNHTVFKKMTWKNGIIIKAEHVGGSDSRTIQHYLDSGEVWLKTAGKTYKLWG